MNAKTKTGLEILQAAVLLGVLGDVLLRQMPWGLNVLLFAGAFSAAMIMLVVRRRSEFWNAPNIALNGALIFFAAMFGWRDSAELQVFDALVILTILAVLMLPALNIKQQIAGVAHFAAGFAAAGISTAIAPFSLIFSDIKWQEIPQTGWRKHLVSILRGVVIALPMLLIFGALFVAADAVFQGIVERTFNVEPDVVIAHVFFIGFFSWLVAGYLRGSLMENFIGAKKVAAAAVVVAMTPEATAADTGSKSPASSAPETEIVPRDWQHFDNSILPGGFTLGAIEITIVLGLINLLFLAFVVVQIPYLFGGFELVQNTPDFKLAEYARRGFGELVTVAALVLPILLASHWLLRKDSPLNEKIYRALAGVQIVLLFVIMASAVQRLMILTGNVGYGLTTVRLYPMIFMVWIALVFVWFAVTVLRGAREKFAWGALWTAFFVLAAAHVLNPDDLIARTNINLMNQGRVFDAQYNFSLSDDALPVLIENLPAMNFEQGCTAKILLSQRLSQTNGETDFRSWNRARRTARELLLQNTNSLDPNGCPSTAVTNQDDF